MQLGREPLRRFREEEEFEERPSPNFTLPARKKPVSQQKKGRSSSQSVPSTACHHPINPCAPRESKSPHPPTSSLSPSAGCARGLESRKIDIQSGGAQAQEEVVRARGESTVGTSGPTWAHPGCIAGRMPTSKNVDRGYNHQRT